MSTKTDNTVHPRDIRVTVGDVTIEPADGAHLVARRTGIAGAVADVREFHSAAMEGNPQAMLHERTEAPALVRRVSRYRLLREEYEETIEANLENDLPGTLDGLVDMAYVIIGTALIQFGGDRFERAWKAVHESNMAKRWPYGRFHIREDGKIEKPPGWVGPDIEAIVFDRESAVSPTEIVIEARHVQAGDVYNCDGEWKTVHDAWTSEHPLSLGFRSVTMCDGSRHSIKPDRLVRVLRGRIGDL